MLMFEMKILISLFKMQTYNILMHTQHFFSIHHHISEFQFPVTRYFS